MAPGQYFVVVQHPMYNGRFDVFPDNPNNPIDILGAYPVYGNVLFAVGGAGSLQGSDAANALIQALNNPAVDDTYTKLQFLVEVPKITIDPIGDHQVGDRFTITGTTNLAVDDQNPRSGDFIVVPADIQDPERGIQRCIRHCQGCSREPGLQHVVIPGRCLILQAG